MRLHIGLPGPFSVSVPLGSRKQSASNRARKINANMDRTERADAREAKAVKLPGKIGRGLKAWFTAK